MFFNQNSSKTGLLLTFAFSLHSILLDLATCYQELELSMLSFERSLGIS